MWEKIKNTTIYKWLIEAFGSAMKSLIEKPIKTIVTILLSMVGIFTATNTESIFKQYQTYTTDQKMHDELRIAYEEIKQLRGDLKSAQATNLYDKKQFNELFKVYINSNDKNFKRVVDSLVELKKKVVSFEQGKGTVNISGGGEMRNGEYTDEWINAIVQIDSSNKMNFDYGFNFDLKDVSVEYEDQTNGSKNEIYSVRLQSLKDTNAVYTLGDYVRTVKYLSEVPNKQKPQQTSINGDIASSGHGIEGSLSISLWAWNNGATEKDIIMRLPEFGVSSNLRDSHNIFIGARYNIARHLPLFQNIYISLKYGLNFGQANKNVLFGFGVTL